MAGLGTSDLSETLRLISGIRPAAILYGCTSATLTHGVKFDQELAEQIKVSSGAVSITAASSLVAAMKALHVTKIGFASPYLGEVNDQAVQFFASEGITTVHRADIGKALGNYGQGELKPEEITKLALRADGPDVQAIVLSCTDMRAVETIGAVEAQTGKPVITSNQAMVFQLCKALGLRFPARPWGTLLT